MGFRKHCSSRARPKKGTWRWCNPGIEEKRLSPKIGDVRRYNSSLYKSVRLGFKRVGGGARVICGNDLKGLGAFSVSKGLLMFSSAIHPLLVYRDQENWSAVSSSPSSQGCEEFRNSRAE